MKTKIILLLLIFSFAGFAQQKAKMQKADESGMIEVDEAPVLKSQIKPEYPKLAKLAGIQGKVYLKLLIDEKGNVAKTKIEQGVKDMIDDAALAAVKDAKFSPALIAGKPVKVWVVLPIAFKLNADKNDTSSKETGEEPDPGAMVEYEKAPEMIEAAKPYYPEAAQQAGVTGKVYVKVLVDKEGIPKKAVVLKSESELFNESAVDAAMKSRFTPAIQDGKPIAVWIVLPYSYALGDNKKK